MELKDRELKGKEVKIKGKMEDLVFKPIIASIDDMDKFEQKKKEENKANWKHLVWLIN